MGSNFRSTIKENGRMKRGWRGDRKRDRRGEEKTVREEVKVWLFADNMHLSVRDPANLDLKDA